jgi:AcrR family transcriptional regulator
VAPPLELPLLADRRERADAAANRARILAAARRLLEEQGVPGISMDAVAAAAGVGKGTIFRRFGSRAGLTHALLDEYMRAFQDAVISGPPPLGPGASPQERLEAFCLELIETQQTHIELALAAEPAVGEPPAGAYSFLLLHLQRLVGEVNPEVDARVMANLVLGLLAPPVLYRLRIDPAVDPASIKAGVLALLRGLGDVRADARTRPG